MKILKLGIVALLLSLGTSSITSCEKYDDDDDDRYRRSSRPSRPNTKPPEGCHWEWDDGRWELDCD